jgi:uncharacterized membrane protein
MFEPYTDPVSSKRRRILSFDAHPIVVHFAISFSVSAFAVALFIIVFPSVFRQTATGAFRVFVGALPLVVIAAFLSGRFDAKVRFRKVKGLLLKRKTAIGIGFFCLSVIAAVLAFAVGPYVGWVRAVDAVLLAGCVGCAFQLGRIGSSLLCALFPG